MTFDEACEDRDIYEAAQRYRHAPLADQPAVVEAYREMLRAVWDAAKRSKETS